MINYIKSKNITTQNTDTVELIKMAYNCEDNMEKKLINKLWQNDNNMLDKIKNVIPVVDISQSLKKENKNAYYASIGLGCKIAEKSSLGKRMLLFNNSPKWLNLDKCKNVCDMVDEIKNVNDGMNSNFFEAMKLIVKEIKSAKMTKREIEELTFVILSDMQFDNVKEKDGINSKTVMEIMKDLFEDVSGNLPTIIFWNLRQTNGFPDMSYKENVIMVSGYNFNLLNILFNREPSKIIPKTYNLMNTWNMIDVLLNHTYGYRYNVVNKCIDK